MVIFIPAYFGIRLGAAFATVLGVLSMLPITAMIFLPFFKSGSIHWGNVAGFHAPPHVHVSVTFICAWFFPILWNVIAMEAAACYVGECRGGARDAKIALTAEGIFGMFIYIATPLMFVAVLGLALTSADPLTLYLTYTDHIFGPGSWEKWFVGMPLILALALSVLNAIMGVRPVAVPGGRGRPAAALVRAQEPARRAGQRDGVQRGLLARSWCCSARRCGSTSSPTAATCCPARSPSAATSSTGTCARTCRGRSGCRPFAKWGALAVFVVWMVIYFFGGWNSPKIILNDPNQGPGLYLLGLLIVALYAPLYWWRAWQDRGWPPRAGSRPPRSRSPRPARCSGEPDPPAARPDRSAADPESAGDPPVVR